MRRHDDAHHHSLPRRLRQLLGARPARRALLRRAAALAVCGVVCVSVVQRVQDAERTRVHWGTTTELLVASRDLPPGWAIGPDDLRRVEWPTALVPSGALDELPAGARLRAPMAHGEALVAHRVDGSDRGEWAAMLTPEQVAIQLPLSAPLPGAAAGDLVDVLAPDTATAPDLTGGVAAERVATGARLLHVDEQHATVAVRSDEAVDTAGAALGGLVTVVVRP
jgi:Flp pilus assembly protein CpaB